MEENKLLFKPLKYVVDPTKYPLVFDREGQEIINPNKSIKISKSFRPIIIFYDSENENYYYVKGRSARRTNGDLSRKYEEEILVKGTSIKNHLFEKDTYIDCSQIFVISKQLLHKIIDFKSDAYELTKQVSENTKELILDKIKDNLKNKHYSLVEVFYDKIKDKTKGSTLFANKNLYAEDVKNFFNSWLDAENYAKQYYSNENNEIIKDLKKGLKLSNSNSFNGSL